MRGVSLVIAKQIRYFLRLKWSGRMGRPSRMHSFNVLIAIKRHQFVEKIANIISIHTSEGVSGTICGYHQNGV